MKSNRWWLRQINLRTYRKWNGYGGNPGTTCTLDVWERMLNEVRALRPGDHIYNLMTDSYSEIKSVEFIWGKTGANIYQIPKKFDWREPVKERRIPGQAIVEFEIHTMDGRIVRECPSEAEYYRERRERQEAAEIEAEHRQRMAELADMVKSIA